jgi:hypothetical protein
MRRALAILALTSAVFTVPVIAQIGGRPMTFSVARVVGPETNQFIRDAARLAPTPNGTVNAHMTLRALNIIEAGRVTHAAVYFRFRVDPTPNPAPDTLIRIEADGADANIQNRQFMSVDPLPGGGKGAQFMFRARARRYDNSNPPREVEQQGNVMIQIEDYTPGASQRPNPGAQPDRVTITYQEGSFTYTYRGVVRDTGVVREGDIYVHRRSIPRQF